MTNQIRGTHQKALLESCADFNREKSAARTVFKFQQLSENEGAEEHYDNLKDFGLYIKNLRRSVGLSRSELSFAAGAPREDIFSLENGILPHEDVWLLLPKINLALGVTEKSLEEHQFFAMAESVSATHLPVKQPSPTSELNDVIDFLNSEDSRVSTMLVLLGRN